MRRDEWKPAFDASMRFHAYVYNNLSIDPEMVVRLWRSVFGCVLKSFGVPKKSRRLLWEELVKGNWGRLHQTERECELSSSQWLGQLHDEVWYCSDRWSLDRLTRCHWLYRQYVAAIESEAA